MKRFRSGKRVDGTIPETRPPIWFPPTVNTLPGSGEEGETYLQSSDNLLYIHDGTSYVAVGAIADGSITTAKLADGSVTEPKLASNAVTTTKIADASVTKEKLGTISNSQVLVTDALGAITSVAYDSSNTANAIVLRGSSGQIDGGDATFTRMDVTNSSGTGDAELGSFYHTSATSGQQYFRVGKQAGSGQSAFLSYKVSDDSIQIGRSGILDVINITADSDGNNVWIPSSFYMTGTANYFRPPRLTTTNRDGMSLGWGGTQDGSIIFNTTTSKLQVWAGSTWVDLH